MRAAAFGLLLLLVAGAARPASPAPPRLLYETPPELAGVATRLRALGPEHLAGAMRLTGLPDGGPPIRVVLAPEGSALARRVPPWVSGYAFGDQGLVVLLPARSPTYPDDTLEDLLRHEVAHVLVARAALGREVPRWFHEGVALVAGDAWGLDDRTRLSVALLRGDAVPLAELDRRFAGHRGEVEGAYAVSGGFVRDLLRRHGPGVTGEILAGVARGSSFEAAFARATGRPLAEAESSFWGAQALWYRWVPLLTSSVTVWLLVMLVALWAFHRRRERTAALRRRWEEEEPGGPTAGRT